MIAHWITFKTRGPACVEAPDAAAAQELAATLTGAEVTSARVLPYPAEPRIGRQSTCPSFCYSPARCAGLTACPNRHACSE